MPNTPAKPSSKKEAKKAEKPASPKKPAAPVATGAHTLDSLEKSLGAPDPALCKALFKRVSEPALVETGTKIESMSLVGDVPGFVSATLEIEKHLSPDQRRNVKLPKGLLAILVAESIILRSLRAQLGETATAGAGDKAKRDAASRQESREGIAQRDVVYAAFRNAFGPDGMDEVDAVVGTAETPEALATGLAGLATLIRKLRAANSDDAALMDAFELDETCSASLEEKAARVRKAGEVQAAPEKRVTQRRVDLQDGRVAHLIGIVLRAFRAANRADSSILLPPLQASAWLFEVRTGKPKAATPPEPRPS